jgi:hypothetical protein
VLVVMTSFPGNSRIGRPRPHTEDRTEPESDREHRLANARRANQQQVGLLLDEPQRPTTNRLAPEPPMAGRP